MQAFKILKALKSKAVIAMAKASAAVSEALWRHEQPWQAAVIDQAVGQTLETLRTKHPEEYKRMLVTYRGSSKRGQA